MTNPIKGVDVFLVKQGLPKISPTSTKLQLTTIFNRGTKVFPGPDPVCHLTDVHQCRFEVPEDSESNLEEINTLLMDLQKQGFHWCEVHNIYNFD